ncbi:uncharacterized protein LOC114566925 [Perca flavescens]|uniref:uncharacterized protein LOC114566925 n=1 Tax=Perca flavescens TaxID=8167 RepID=UPI00106EBE70|nr:uncharacterized protein LOC114566925 [Perca flavescens]
MPGGGGVGSNTWWTGRATVPKRGVGFHVATSWTPLSFGISIAAILMPRVDRPVAFLGEGVLSGPHLPELSPLPFCVSPLPLPFCVCVVCIRPSLFVPQCPESPLPVKAPRHQGCCNHCSSSTPAPVHAPGTDCHSPYIRERSAFSPRQIIVSATRRSPSTTGHCFCSLSTGSSAWTPHADLCLALRASGPPACQRLSSPASVTGDICG